MTIISKVDSVHMQKLINSMNISVGVPIRQVPSIGTTGDVNTQPKKLRHASVNRYVHSPQAIPADVSRLQTFLKYNTPCAAGGALLVLTLAAIFQGWGIFLTGLTLGLHLLAERESD